MLVPLDGSTRAERALPVAARIARATGGSIVLLQAASFPVDYGPDFARNPSYAQTMLDDELATAKKYLTSVADTDDLAGIKTETEAAIGTAAETILTYAQVSNVDLIIMCSHGETGFNRWALGRMVQKVARHSCLPVLVLREEDPEPLELQADATHPLRALVALDGSSLAEAILIPAAHLVAALAAPAQGALHLTRVVQLPTTHHGKERDVDLAEQAQAEAVGYLSAITDTVRNELAAELGLKITSSVTMNEDVADTLIRMAESGEGRATFEVQGWSLIALATHGRGGLQRWIVGSITERVLAGSKLPLLIVRPQKQQPPVARESTVGETTGR
ncbi:MAG TPA: universal stress protein [Ktedonobacteraceae bacterium]|nr:universal stress protein [Ktedonobacteraceae bacterium]